MNNLLFLALTSVKAYSLPQVNANQSTLQSVLGIAFGIIGAIALLTITISGLRYITSAGDPQKASDAKSGIIYSLIGLVVAISAEAIVVFVIGRLQ
jgi:hypothetical protein